MGGVQPVVDLDHGHLDDVCGGALHGGVDGGAFGGLAALAVAAADFRQVEAAAEQGFHVALFRGLGAGFFHVAFYAGVAFEVQVDVVLGFLARQAQLFGETKGAHAVDQAEVDGLGVAAVVVADLVQALAPHFCGGGAVNIQAFFEGIGEALVAA